MLWELLTEPGTSSTRAEFVSALLSLAVSGAGHIASDRKNFVDGATAILANPFAEPRKPWSLTSDGDLWELFQRHVQLKGSNSIAVQKVKGHATLQDVENRVTSAYNRIGKNFADYAATKGINSYGSLFVGLFKMYAYRQHFLCALLEHIHSPALARNAAEAEKRQADMRNLAFVNGGKGTIVPTTVPVQPPSGNGEGCRALALRSPFSGGSQGTLTLHMQT